MSISSEVILERGIAGIPQFLFAGRKNGSRVRPSARDLKGIPAFASGQCGTSIGKRTVASSANGWAIAHASLHFCIEVCDWSECFLSANCYLPFSDMPKYYAPSF